jgi:hypothetical protein
MARCPTAVANVRQVRGNPEVGSSTAIEGFRLSEADVTALVRGHEPLDPEDDDRMAVSCYARAIDRVIKDLHLDAGFFDWDRNPGSWHEAPISVTAESRPEVLDMLRYMRGSEPLPGYDALSPEQVARALAGADAETVKAVRDYERKFGTSPASAGRGGASPADRDGERW